MSEQNKITIAVDGYSSCGKSTLAKALAKKLHYVFIDSGAMYRGITLFAIQHDLIYGTEVNEEALIAALSDIKLDFRLNTERSPELYLNGVNVEEEIRTSKVSSVVSYIARIKEVRTKLVQLQREMGKNGGIVMDGRDIGSVVFPNAELKLFITASIEVRTQRRYQELLAKGIQAEYEEVRDNLIQRDLIDSTRSESPLIQTPDAVVIDNSELTREDQLNLAYELATGVLNEHKEDFM